MGANATARVVYNVALILEDMADKGWRQNDLARAARLTEQRVSLFLRGDIQTAPTAKAIADALRRPVRRYITPATAASEARV